MKNTHCILLAHGSRDSRWCDTFESGLESIIGHLDYPSSLAYMEMATPSLEQVIDKEYEAGVRVFEILPLFFAAGRHLLIDVPEQLDLLRLQLQDVTIRLHPPIGKEPDFWDFLGIMLNKKIPILMTHD
jgi:sirohydrochlorin cobaltochelatase